MGEASFELTAIRYKIDAISLLNMRLKWQLGCVDPLASIAMGQVGPKGKTDE